MQDYINHVGLVLDASGSMQRHAANVIKVADGLVQHLARRSKELDQETRIAVYTFNSQVKCLTFDRDVLRLPSIRTLYTPSGQTALIDATVRAVDELGQTPQMYGDHSFLLYVVTDGEENCSSRFRHQDLQNRLGGLADNWTVAALVPNPTSVHEAKRFGFPAGNIAIWDTNSDAGVEEVGRTITHATDSYMAARATGTRSTRNLFGGAAQVNAATVATTGLKPLDRAKYMLHPIPKISDKTEVRDYVVNQLGRPFRLGTVFYELMKPEYIQANKVVAVLEKGTDKLYVGGQVRQMLGLPDAQVRVKPDFNPSYKIFVQSNSTNRHLVPHTTLLLLN